MELLKEKLNFVSSQNWEYYIMLQEELCKDYDVKFLDILKEKINILVNKVNWEKQQVTVNYLIPEKLDKFKSVDIIQFLISGLIRPIHIDFYNDKRKKLFTFNGLLERLKNPDWHIEFSYDGILTLVVKYDLIQNVVS